MLQERALEGALAKVAPLLGYHAEYPYVQAKRGFPDGEVTLLLHWSRIVSNGDALCLGPEPIGSQGVSELRSRRGRPGD